MAVQKIRHGATIETLTPDELRGMLGERAENAAVPVARVRAKQIVLLDGTGAGILDVYEVPVGREFETRRVMLNLDTAADPSTGNVALNVAGKFVQYLRSGEFIEYANPSTPAGGAGIPGIQTWAREQGPYLRNGEVFQAKAAGLTAASKLTVEVEGILFEPKHKQRPAAPNGRRGR